MKTKDLDSEHTPPPALIAAGPDALAKAGYTRTTYSMWWRDPCPAGFACGGGCHACGHGRWARPIAKRGRRVA